MVDVPVGPLGGMFSLLDKMGFKGFDPGIIWRFKEDTNISTADLFHELGVSPWDFESGLRSAVVDWGLAS